VRPPDLVVAQGEMTWQPVQPPREEEYLGEISLGLHTIESFDVEAPKPYEARVQDFQEMSFDQLDVESSAPPAAPAVPTVESEPSPPVSEQRPGLTGDVSLPPGVTPADAAVFNWAQLPKSPLPGPPAGPPKIQQNKSSFETWLNRLKGGRR
jgi:hypothetical protein